MKPVFVLASELLEGRIPSQDFHLHTSWTDGTNTVEEMFAQATSCGLTEVLFSEHVRRGSASWFHEFAREVRAQESISCEAYVGAEAKVLDEGGALDVDDEVVAACDMLVAVVHRFPGEQDEDVRKKTGSGDPLRTELGLALAALDNPHTAILGHPMGMCVRRFGLTPPDSCFEALIEKCAARNIAFEINPLYHPDPWHLIRLCSNYGARVSLGSNAHEVASVGRVQRILRGEEA